MGLLFSYFRRPKDAVAELEGIEATLSRLDTRRQSQLRLQKRLLGYLLMAFLLGYPAALAVYYAYCMPVSSWLAQAAHAAAFVAALPLFYGLRRCLLWSFVRSLAGCESRMRQLREDKQRVLDRVMDTETYKRAKEILDRFDPDRFKAEFHQQQQQQQLSASSTVKPGQFFAKSPLSRRPPPQLQQATQLPASRGGTPPHQLQQLPSAPGGGGVVLRQLSAVPSQQPPPQLPPGGSQPPPHHRQPAPQSQPPQLPRPVLSRERSLMDRVIDLLVGDGADRRYALICRRCSGHNGMAMAEEFPYLAWRCAYCTYMHAPRQLRPLAPPLAPVMSPQQQQQQQRPQWQSLIDLRPSQQPLEDSPVAPAQSLRSSSSVGSTSSLSSRPSRPPSPAAAPSVAEAAEPAAAVEKAANGTAGGDAEAESEAEAEAEAEAVKAGPPRQLRSDEEAACNG